MSYLLHLSTGDVPGPLGKNVLQLFRILPLKLWQPTLDELALLREWILKPIDSIPFQLARHIFDTLNWSETSSNQFFLGETFHNRAALIVIEVREVILTLHINGIIRHTTTTTPQNGQISQIGVGNDYSI
jgi:hypothetical protein